jgi:spermidine synthase
VETRSGVVTVSRWGAVFGGGAYDGRISTSLTDDRNATVRAYAVAAVHPRPRRVLMVGLATGAWAHVLAQMPGVESLTVVEIDPGYLRLIAKYPEVSGLLSNPRVRIVIDDGRRWLSRHPGETFDVIVMNTTWHWRAHVTNLLSYEYLQLVRRHLRPGGIYHFNTTSSEDAIYTAFTTFPFGVRFRSMATVSDSPISVDGERWRRVLSEYTLDGRPVFDLTRPEGRAQLDRIVALTQTLNTPSSRQSAFEWRESVLARLEGARLITDDNMAPEWQRLFEYVWIPRDER